MVVGSNPTRLATSWPYQESRPRISTFPCETLRVTPARARLRHFDPMLDGAAIARAIAAFLVLNALAKLRFEDRIEKTVFAAITATAAVLSVFVAVA